ncbi:MAG TPA: hypothetical protein OIL99_16405 [Clostridiales bacterium]|nr:hypothetical protein [Clostridiales bacterium]
MRIRRSPITEEIKKQTKPSIVEALRRGMEEQRKKDSEKQAQEKQKKQNMNCKALAVFIVKMSGVFLVP